MSPQQVAQGLRAWPGELVTWEKDAFTVSTPIELGAKNWIAILTFKDGELARIAYRTPDSLDLRPPDNAPPDV